jgi:hypothetical protein
VAKKRKRNPAKRKAAPASKKMRRVTGSTGWIKANAVRFIKKAGKPIQVLVRRTRKRARRTKKR